MGGDMCQGQSSPFVLEAEPVLVFPRFALTLALAHTENECRLLLVDLRGGSRGGGVLSYMECKASPAAALSGAPALTENQSTWLKLPWEWEGPHLSRAVLPTSTSTSSGSSCSASPGTPGGERRTTQQLSAPAALHSLPSHQLTAAVLPVTSRV